MNIPYPSIFHSGTVWKIGINRSCILPYEEGTRKGAIQLAKKLHIAAKSGKLFCQVSEDNKRFELLDEAAYDADEIAVNGNGRKLDKLMETGT